MQFFNGLEHPIVFSLLPGVSATPLMANSISSLVNTYRVTGDDWDEWSAILAHFNVARSLTKFFLYMFEFKIHGLLFHLTFPYIKLNLKFLLFYPFPLIGPHTYI